MRRSLLILLLAAVPAVSCGGDSASGGAEPRRPDVLLVSLDTLRADRLSCFGHERETSPRIDAIAAEGVRFAEAHAPSSNTKPSHMSLFTGLDPLSHDVRPVKLNAPERPALAESIPTLPEILRRAGYQTASFTDRGGLPPSAGFARGFDHLRAEWEELPRKIAAVAWYLRNGARPDQPLFLFFHTYETHAPYLPPEPFRGRYTDPAYDGDFRRRHDELAGTPMAEFWREKGKFLEPWPEMSAEDVRFLSDLYDEEIAWTDQEIGRLWRIWKRERGADTLLVLLSDHGEEFLEHEGLGHQRSLHAELMRVPLVLVGPGLPRGRVVHAPTSLTGVLPTVLDYLGLPAVDTQAPSFLDLALGGTEREPGPVFSQMGNRGSELFESVTDGGLRLIRTTTADGERVELYDWTVDGDETDDLAPERAADVARLTEALDARSEEAERVRELHPPGEESLPTADEAREIEALGYAGDD